MLVINFFKRFFSVRAIVAIGVFLILVSLLLWSRERIKTLESKVSSYKSIINKARNNKFYTDRKGRSHAVTSPIIISENSVMKELVRSDLLISRLSKDVKGLRKNLSNLEHAIFVNSVTTNNINTIVRDSLVIVNDTVRVLYQKFRYRTPWTEKSGEIVNGVLSLKEKNFDSVIVTTYWKKKWLLGRKHFFTEGFSKNPNSEILIFNSIIKKGL